MNLSEIQQRMSRLNDWALEGDSIVKHKTFQNFKETMEFVNKIAEIAEKNNHHPGLVINYNNLRISLTTHYARGLTEKDFEVAEEIDKL